MTKQSSEERPGTNWQPGQIVFYGARRHRINAVKLGGIAGPHATLTCLHDDDDCDDCDGTGGGHAWTSVALLVAAAAQE